MSFPLAQPEQSVRDGRAPGRPRDPSREAAILATVLDLVSAGGLDAVTFEEVARRARCSKATLYRRWATRQEMVVAAVTAVASGGSAPPPVDTGSLRGDLLELVGRLEASMDVGGPVSLLLLQAGVDDHDFCDEIEAASGPTGARLPANVIEAAVGRGELPEDVDPFAYEEAAGSVLLVRKLTGLTTDRAYREQLVDSVLLPALRNSVRGAQRGIFSGAPTSAPSSDRKDDPQP